MARRSWLFIAFLLIFAACEKKEAVTSFSSKELADKAPEARAPGKRYIAEEHQLLIEVPDDKLQSTWQKALDYCRKQGFDLLNTGIENEKGQSPSASFSARVIPEKLDPFLKFLSGSGRLIQHRTDSRDKTETVLDTEARIRNLTALRDRLRQMLNIKTAGIRDVIEIERQLSETQAQLDGMTATGKALANETEKVAVYVQYRSRSASVFFAPAVSAFKEAGEIFGKSLGALIRSGAAVLPWIIVLIPLYLALKTGFKKIRKFSKPAKNSGPGTPD